MREAEREVERLALHLGAVTGADELERLHVAVGGALDHPVDDRAGEALEARAVAAGDGRDDVELGALDLDLHVRRERRARACPFGPFTSILPFATVTVTPFGSATGRLPTRD